MNQQQKRAFKDQLYEQFARISRALGSAHRLELIDVLAQGERTVEELAQETSMSIASTSQHLQTLRAAQLVEVRREGTYAYYRLANERVFEVWQILRDLGETQLAEIERIVESFLTERQAFEAINIDELQHRIGDGNIVLLDVRPEEEYSAGHIPSARSIPVQELEFRLGEIPAHQDIIAYCRGPYCVFADEAISILHNHGFTAQRLTEGLPDWRARGLPVESTADENGG